MRVLRAALQFYRRTEDVDNDMEEMDTEDSQQKVAKTGGDDGGAGEAGDSQHVEKKTFPLKQLFVSADLRRPLFIACMLQVIQQFSGINAVSLLAHRYTCRQL